ncbi:MAG: universal stress protein [Roseinatronobacter sp.]
MPQIRTILAATDLTPRSGAVVPRAAQLAHALGARLVLASVLPVAPHPLHRLRLKRPVLTRDAAKVKLAQMAQASGLSDVQCVVVDGPVAPSLITLTREYAADLLIMGLHKARPVLDTLRLSTMERVTLAVPCPVLVAHQRTIAPYRSVLGAVTFAPASAHAMAIAAKLAPEAEFHAIHALQARKRDLTDAEALLDTTAMTEADMLRQAFLTLPDLPAHLHRPEIIPGGVHEVISFRLTELKPDLLVIGSHSGRNPDALGNYARDLMRAPPTDLLIAKPI